MRETRGSGGKTLRRCCESWAGPFTLVPEFLPDHENTTTCTSGGHSSRAARENAELPSEIEFDFSWKGVPPCKFWEWSRGRSRCHDENKTVGRMQLQSSCLENPMDRGAWRATVHGVTRVGQDRVTFNSIQNAALDWTSANSLVMQKREVQSSILEPPALPGVHPRTRDDGEDL